MTNVSFRRFRWPSGSRRRLPARAQGAADPAAATVQDFYDALVASMKAGGTAKSRYDKLKPAVEQAFDIPGMTALSVGPTWSSIAAGRPEGADRCVRAHDRRQLCAQFRQLSAARNSPSIRR